MKKLRVEDLACTDDIGTAHKKVLHATPLKAGFSRALDLTMLAVPVEAVLSRFFPEEILDILGHGHLAALISKVIYSTNIYTSSLWTLLGMILINRRTFITKQKRSIGIAIPLAAMLVALLSLFEGAARQIGSDSVAEVTRTQWDQALIYTHQFLQTSFPSTDHLLCVFALIVTLLCLDYLGRTRIYKPSVWIAGTSSIVMLLVLVLCLYVDISSYFESRSSYATYERNLRQGTQRGLSHFKREQTAPAVLIYIGESSNRDALYVELKSRLRDPELNKNAVLFSDVISPHSHTFLALIRTLTIAGDPERDQLIDDKYLSRVNLVSVLKANGIATAWISNKPAYEWVGALFGQQADDIYIQNKDSPGLSQSLQKKDDEVLPLALDKLKMNGSEREVVFFHSQAGHADYCDNIPRTAVSRIPDPDVSLPFSAIYGELPLLSHNRQRDDIVCYRNAMSYVADNLVYTMRQLAAQKQPVVLIYFSDHGEDVLDATGHESNRPSFRKIEVPLLVYFNDAARQAYEDKFQASLANKDKRYGTTWLSDSILDIAGVSDDRRASLSIFGPLDRIPDRYSSLRSYGGKQHVIDVDGNERSLGGIEPADIDLYVKRKLIQSLPAEQQGRICASCADSLLKFSDASRAFLCIAADLVVDPQRHQVFVYRPPQKNGGLTLDSLLDLQTKQPTQLWLNLTNANYPTLELLLSYLDQRIPAEKRNSIFLEIAPDAAENNNLREVLSRIRRDGYGLSYSLQTETGMKCSRGPQISDCDVLRTSIEEALQSTPYSSLSFDIRTKEFAVSIHRPAGVEMNTWDLAVKTGKDLDRDMLQRVTKYMIPYESVFDY